MSITEEPITIGRVEVKNRFVLPPMVTKFATDKGEVTEKLIRYYQVRAGGGAGLIIVEASNVSPAGRFLWKQIEVHDDRYTAGLERLSYAIKSEGAKAFIQLNQGGTSPVVTHDQTLEEINASSVDLSDGFIPRPFSRDEIKEAEQSFVNAAFRAYEAGFDGVELHCAHMYLLCQLLSPMTNKRADEYGSERTRLVTDIIDKIKNVTGDDFAVICRINGFESMPEGLTVEDAVANARGLEKGGADGIHVSAQVKLSKWGPEDNTACPNRHFDEGTFVPYSRAVRSAVDIPVIAVGRIAEMGLAKSILEEKAADMIAVGRGYIADPEIINKWQDGRDEEVNKCILCNKCLSALLDTREGEIICPVNPALGTEEE